MPVTALSYVTVTGNLQRLDGTAAEGVVEFYTDVQLINTVTNQIVVPGTVSARLVAGAFSVSLPATDDSDFSPTGWTYAIREVVDDTERRYSISLPASPSTVDLADVIAVDSITAGSESSGEIKIFPITTPPAGWLLCDGAAISRTTYAKLFAVIGTIYGVGNGTTTFNIPNLKGKVVVGVDAAQTEFDVIGETGGEKTHVLTTAELASHNHTQNSHNHTQNSHTHAVQARPDDGTSTGTFFPTAEQTTQGVQAYNTDAATATNIAATATNNAAGSDTAHNNLQPYIALSYIIKT